MSLQSKHHPHILEAEKQLMLYYKEHQLVVWSSQDQDLLFVRYPQGHPRGRAA